MADNVDITAGTGTTVATEDEAGVHYQVIKLAASGTGTTEALTKAEDSAHATGNHGIMALVVRKDTAAALAGTDGDYIPLIVDASGRLHIAPLVAGSAAIGKLAANTGVDIGDVDVTSIVPGVAATNLGKAEDAGHSSGDVGVMAMTVRQDTAAALSGTDADYQPIISDASGRVHVNVGALPASTNTIEVVGDVAEDAAVAGNPVLVGGRYDSAARTLDNGDVGAIALDAAGAAHSVGNVAHDAADAGSPVKVGGKAHPMDATAPGTAVVENDRTHFITDFYGRQFVETCHPNLWSASDNQSSAQTNTALKAAPGAGLSLYITDVILSNGATAGNVKFVEDTGGTPVDKIEVMYFAINGGAVIPFKTPIKITANKDFGYTSVTVTTHSITVCGFIAP